MGKTERLYHLEDGSKQALFDSLLNLLFCLCTSEIPVLLSRCEFCFRVKGGHLGAGSTIKYHVSGINLFKILSTVTRKDDYAYCFSFSSSLGVWGITWPRPRIRCCCFYSAV